MRALFDEALGCVRPLLGASRALGRGDPLLAAFAERLSGGADAIGAWKAALAQESARGGYAAWLEEEEKTLSRRLVEALAAGTRTSALARGERALTGLEKLRAEAEETCAAKSRVYRTLGVLMGAGACILLL